MDITKKNTCAHNRTQGKFGYCNFCAKAWLVRACRRALQAPGIHTTDQKTGDTFAALIEKALQKAGA